MPASRRRESIPESLREQAILELDHIEVQGGYVGLSRRGRLGDPAFERRLTDLVSGVTRWKRWLDFQINSFHSAGGEGLEPTVRMILRVGVYELLLTSVPVHAAINENVNTAKKLVGRRVTGLVNGLLRNVDRNRSSLPEPASGDEADDLAVRFSHPTWMVRLWLSRYGREDTIQLLEHDNERPVYGIRVRSDKKSEAIGALTDAGVSTQASTYLDDFVRVSTMQSVLRSGFIERGQGLVMDEGAGGVVRIVDPQPGERILDACAAPGGKSLYMADMMGDTGIITSVDLNERRLGLLASEADRLGIGIIHTVTGDLRELGLEELGIEYDRVLLDVPCSGFGVLAKRADMRWRRSKEDLNDLVILQYGLLCSAARFVAPGGWLVYSTCTLEPEENKCLVERFLEENRDFVLEPIKDHVDARLITADGYYESLPFRHGIDGAFAARLKRKP